MGRRARKERAERGAQMVSRPWFSPQPPKSVGGVIESPTEILAWRYWHLVDVFGEGIMLQSVSAGTLWRGPVMLGHDDPSHEHCGVHALKELDWKRSGYRDAALVYGEVALSGRVVEGTNGYRADRAVIQRLFVVPSVCWPEHDQPGTGKFEEPKANNSLITFGYQRQPWPETISVFAAIDALADRYQCDVEIAK